MVSSGGRAAPLWGFSVVAQYPHASSSFTQGLYWDAPTQTLFEGTGMRGASALLQVNLSTGTAIRRLALSSQYFGEGIAPWNGSVYQLTWQARVVFRYTQADFVLRQQFTNPRAEGWGLTHNGSSLILSDGTDNLCFVRAADFTVERCVPVTDDGAPVRRLNELEYIDGEVWANVWLTNDIVVIDPLSGVVTKRIRLGGLYNGSGDVLNGIAFDADARRIFVTGKWWNQLFHIEVHPTPTTSSSPSVASSSSARSSTAAPGLLSSLLLLPSSDSLLSEQQPAQSSDGVRQISPSVAPFLFLLADE